MSRYEFKTSFPVIYHIRPILHYHFKVRLTKKGFSADHFVKLKVTAKETEFVTQAYFKDKVWYIIHIRIWYRRRLYCIIFHCKGSQTVWGHGQEQWRICQGYNKFILIIFPDYILTMSKPLYFDHLEWSKYEMKGESDQDGQRDHV